MSANDTNIVQRQRPKRSLTAYNLYFQEERQRILDAIPDAPRQQGTERKIAARKSHGKIGFAELARVVAAKWKQLSEEDRSPYVHRAAIDKERYRREMIQWRQKEVEERMYAISRPSKEVGAEKKAASTSTRHLSAMGAASIHPNARSDADLGTSEQPTGTNQQSLLSDYSATAAGATLGRGMPSCVYQGHSSGLLTPQMGSSGPIPLSHQLLAQLSMATQQRAVLPPPQFASEPSSATLEQEQLSPYRLDDLGTSRRSHREQNTATENSSLQEFLDGLDNETREHFMRSMLHDPPQAPPPS